MKYLLSFGIMGIGFFSFGQSVSFVNISAGYEHIAHRDKGMSPLMYSGNGFMTDLSWYKEKESKSMHMAVNFAKGFQTSKYDNSISYHRGSGQAFLFYHKRKSMNKQILWGWSINNTFSHRFNPEFVNFRDHYEYFTNFGPAAKYQYPLKIKGRDLTLEAMGHVQLLGFMIRPSYTSSYPPGFLRERSSIANGLWNSIKLFHPGNAWNFGFLPKLKYFLNSGNMLSLGYQYEFYRLDSPNSITQSRGTWYFSLSTRL